MNIIIADVQKEIIDCWESNIKDKPFVTTYHGSIFDVECDAIVSPANSFGFMDGGIDLHISKFFGEAVVEKLQLVIKNNHFGELLVGNAEIIVTNHNKINYMISAPTMRVPMNIQNTPNVYLAVKAVLIEVFTAMYEYNISYKKLIKTIAFPGMGTGVGGVSPISFVRQMNQAINDILLNKNEFPKGWFEARAKHKLLSSNGNEACLDWSNELIEE